MFISIHVIFTLILVCNAFKHSGLDTQALWYEDRYTTQVVNMFLPKAWIQMYQDFINLHLTFYELKTFQRKCKFLEFVYSESHVQAVQFCSLLHKIGVLQLEQAVELLCKEAEVKDPQLKRKIWIPSSPTKNKNIPKQTKTPIKLQ